MRLAHLLSCIIQQGPEAIVAKEVYLSLSAALSRAKELEDMEGISCVELEVIYVHD